MSERPPGLRSLGLRSLGLRSLGLRERAEASVRLRVTAVATLFVLLVTSVGAVVVVVMIGHTVTHSLIDSARQDAAAINAQLARGVAPASASTTGRSDVVVQLVDEGGRVLAANRPSLLDEPARRRVGIDQTERVDGLTDRFTIVAIRAKAPVRARTGVELIVVGRSTEQRDETRAETAGLLALAVPLVSAALAVIVWISIGRALRPVEVMRGEADAITATHLRRRLAVPPGDDEIPRLARTLNEMLDRIDEGQRRQRQFVSDASHELRSPLAVIRQAAEVAVAHPDRVGVRDLADDVLVESLRLEGLVSALLLLARMENDADQPAEEVDVDDVVLSEVQRARAANPEGARIDVSGVGAGRTRGNAVLLAQAFGNLLSNARRHAAAQVAVTLREDGDGVVLQVDDDGNGVPVAERGAVFERFVRLDEARARDEGGAGLGLAIVRSIVDGHGGSVRVLEAPLGGARFEVRLPRAD
ncbi:MAG: HAMP domain-containing protein [Nocardioidaceae bacterium]|nr:HAMP domain-containing protein [Nocardioidaceae bacterium]